MVVTVGCLHRQMIHSLGGSYDGGSYDDDSYDDDSYDEGLRLRILYILIILSTMYSTMYAATYQIPQAATMNNIARAA